MTDYAPIDLSRLRTLSLAQRPSKVRIEDFARPARTRASFEEFFAALPKILFFDAGQKDGAFGMTRETGELIHDALAAAGPEAGLGAAIGRQLLAVRAPHAALSILAVAARLRILVTAHVAIGTDIMHMRAGASGAALGQASFTDFRLFTAVIADLAGGVYINAGSAAILPEVFLKAFTIAQNLGANRHDFITVNLDTLPHYRPTVNVVQRPVRVGGRGYTLNGRLELLIPLLAFAVVDALGG